jgi:SAM-dependent MidA family methyltransferase
VNPQRLSSESENGALRDIITSRIRVEGPISFRDFMELTLYHPVHGYYVTCDPARDYQSSPNVHPIFGACVAAQLAEMWRLLERPARFDVFEAGAGSGRLAVDVLIWLERHEPDFFDALRYRLQDATYGAAVHAGSVIEALGLPEAKVSAGADLPRADEIEGCLLSNELIDAFPVHRVRVEGGRLLEIRVGLDGGRFVDVPAGPSPELACYFDRLGLLPGEGCDAEVNLDAVPWIRRAAAALRRGYVFTFDYGYEAHDLYAAWRRRGTLLTFYRHTSGEDPYVRIGRQDMTASVDFTTLTREGEAAGLRTLGLTTQAELLAALGIGDTIAQRPDPSQLEAYYALRRAVLELLDPAGLGRVKILAQGKQVPYAPLAGLRTPQGSRG